MGLRGASCHDQHILSPPEPVPGNITHATKPGLQTSLKDMDGQGAVWVRGTNGTATASTSPERRQGSRHLRGDSEEVHTDTGIHRDARKVVYIQWEVLEDSGKPGGSVRVQSSSQQISSAMS